MTTTAKPETRSKKPALKRKKRRKSASGKMSKAELRKLLGIEPEKKPRINRKKLFEDVKGRWTRMEITPFEFLHWFSVIASLRLGEMKAKANSRSSLLTDNRISDEDVGVLKLMNNLLDLYEHREQLRTIGDIMNLLEGKPLDEAKDGDADDLAAP